MGKEADKAFKIMEENADASGNKQAFIEGVVWGLGQGYGFIQQHPQPLACIDVLLGMMDEKYFKPLEENPQ